MKKLFLLFLLTTFFVGISFSRLYAVTNTHRSNTPARSTPDADSNEGAVTPVDFDIPVFVSDLTGMDTASLLPDGMQVGCGMVYEKKNKEAKDRISNEIISNPKKGNLYALRAVIGYLSCDSEDIFDDIDAAIESSDNDLETLLILGTLFLEFGDAESAVEFLEEARDISPDDKSVLKQLALAYTQNGNPQDSLPIIDELISSKTDSAKLYALKCTAKSNADEISGAREDCVRAEKLSQNDPEVLFRVGNLYSSSIGEQSIAIEKYSKALTLLPDFPQARSNRAASYFTDNNYAKAAEDYTWLIDNKNPFVDHSTALFLRGVCRFLLYDFKNAASDFDKSFENDPEQTISLRFRALIHLLDNNPDGAVGVLNKAIAISEDDPELYLQRAGAFYVAHKNKSADKDVAYADSLEINASMNYGLFFLENIAFIDINNYLLNLPADKQKLPFVSIFSSKYHLINGNMNKAIEFCDKTLKSDPEFLPALFQSIALSLVNKDNEKIEKTLKTLEPLTESDRFYYLRGSVKKHNDDTNGAIKDYTKAIELSKDNFGYYLTRGEAYWDDGDFDSSLKDLLKSDELNNNIVRTKYMLGVLHRSLMQNDKALAYFLKSLDLANNDNAINFADDDSVVNMIKVIKKNLSDVSGIETDEITEQMILINIIGCYVALNKTDEALREIENHTDITENYNLAYLMKATAYYLSGDYAKSLELLKTLSKNEKNFVIDSTIALTLLLNTGDITALQEYIKEYWMSNIPSFYGFAHYDNAASWLLDFIEKNKTLPKAQDAQAVIETALKNGDESKALDMMFSKLFIDPKDKETASKAFELALKMKKTEHAILIYNEFILSRLSSLDEMKSYQKRINEAASCTTYEECINKTATAAKKDEFDTCIDYSHMAEAIYTQTSFSNLFVFRNPILSLFNRDFQKNYQSLLSSMSDCYSSRGFSYLEKDKPDEALKDAESAISSAATDGQVLLGNELKAFACTQLDSWQCVIDSLSIAIEIVEDDKETYLRRANAYFSLREYDKAKADLKKSIELDKKFFPAYLLMCYICFTSADNECLKSYSEIGTRVFKENGELSYLYMFLSSSYVQSGDIATAENFIDKAFSLTQKPEAPLYYIVKSSILLKSGKFDAVAKTAEEAIKVFPDHYDGYFDRGVVRYILGKYKEAIDDFNKAISLEPGYITTYYFLAMMDIENGDFDSAIEKLAECRTSDAVYAKLSLCATLATAYIQKNDIQNAKSILELILNIKTDDIKDLPDDVKDTYNFAGFLLKEINTNNKFPNPETLLQIADKELSAGNCKNAMPYLDTAFAFQPKNGDIYYKFGKCAKERGDIYLMIYDYYQYLKYTKDGSHSKEVQEIINSYDK